MPTDVHLIDVNHATFCGARTPKEWNLTAYTLDGARALSGACTSVCTFCERAWNDPESTVVRATSEART